MCHSGQITVFSNILQNVVNSGWLLYARPALFARSCLPFRHLLYFVLEVIPDKHQLLTQGIADFVNFRIIQVMPK